MITFLATQVGVDATAYMQYAWQGRTIEYHRAQIREVLGFRESRVADAEQMQHWLMPRCSHKNTRKSGCESRHTPGSDACTWRPLPQIASPV